MAQEVIPDPLNVSSLSLAYIGDSVYELILRTESLKMHNGSVNDINHYAKQFSNASAQAEIAELIMDDLDEEELRIYKRGRNAKSVSAPHTCTISEYRRATGLEALCGFLFLRHRTDRAKELMIKGIERYKESRIHE